MANLVQSSSRHPTYPASNLPTFLTSFVGRRRETAEVQHFIACMTLRHYQHLLSILHTDLGSPPDAETVALFKRLQRGEEV